MDNILSHFPELSPQQREQFAALDALYREWNARINVISRRDIDNLYLHHVLHSLAILRAVTFRAGSRILDVGTGGGFPGIPLAICCPDCEFKLIDSIGKKVRVALAVADAIGLTNVTTAHCNAIEERGRYDFVVSRGVTNLAELARLTRKNLTRENRNSLPPGIIALKGGNLEGELQPFRNRTLVWDVADFFPEDYFQEKKVVYLQP